MVPVYVTKAYESLLLKVFTSYKTISAFVEYLCQYLLRAFCWLLLKILC